MGRCEVKGRGLSSESAAYDSSIVLAVACKTDSDIGAWDDTCLPAREETSILPACAPPALAAAKTLVAGQSSNRGAQARQGILRPSTGVLEDEILRTGSVIFGFGANDAGQLAVGDIKGRFFPAMVQGGVSVATEDDPKVVTGAPIVSISSGGFHTLLLDAEGSVFAVGENFHGQLGCGRRHLASVIPRHCSVDINNRSLPPMRSVSASLRHSLLLSRDGRLDSLLPPPCAFLPPPCTFLLTLPIFPTFPSCALCDSLTVWQRVFACGCGKKGKLGFDAQSDVSMPREMKTFKLALRRTRRPMGVTKDGYLIDEEEFSSDVQEYHSQYWKKDTKLKLWHNASGLFDMTSKKRRKFFGVEDEPERTLKKVRRKLDRGKPWKASIWEVYNVMLLLQEKQAKKAIEEDWRRKVEDDLKPVEGEQLQNLTAAFNNSVNLLNAVLSNATMEDGCAELERQRALNSLTEEEMEICSRMNISAVLNKYKGAQPGPNMSRDLLMDLWQEYYEQLPIKLNVTCTFCRCRKVNPFSVYHEDILTNNIFTCGYCGMQGKVFDSASLFLPPKHSLPENHGSGTHSEQSRALIHHDFVAPPHSSDDNSDEESSICDRIALAPLDFGIVSEYSEESLVEECVKEEDIERLKEGKQKEIVMGQGTRVERDEDGDEETFTLNPPPKIVAISAGHSHSLLLDSSGRVFSCGDGSYGKLGVR
ncbi:hypothetical protein GUITHDRAFT_111780 [Guillardia theta CCMP2712]|uniref:Uncharacterized protein n=1 Tax=Guillardia theta (strain CCMP2712) TaxID=905079 RepID=L1J1M9_GUITC|nr:hypothetical protein GUITHDRAFT_111780 [Guillardia theta CCMP2712]EKX42217.1 hypothetical protein GUITHDRAFT_111780 [Guillardia theta CCMP2712]|eukprot:XP_005829197.1 hypothetical protein GUITHDRAFT_111780 [Guillardia theta CCMP2712]